MPLRVIRKDGYDKIFLEKRFYGEIAIGAHTMADPSEAHFGRYVNAQIHELTGILKNEIMEEWRKQQNA